MNYWPSDGAEELKALLLQARNNFAAFDYLIHYIEDTSYPNPEGSGYQSDNYENYMYSDEECREYFRFLLDSFILPQKRKIGGVSSKMMREILLMGFGIHQEYPAEKFASIQDRRVAFATDNGMIKHSDKPASVAHSLWWKENKGIDSLVYAIKVDMITREKRHLPLSYGSEVWHRYSRYDLYADAKASDEADLTETLYNTETIDFPEEYTNAFLSASSYRKLNPSLFRNKLDLTVPYDQLRTEEDITTSMKNLEREIRRGFDQIIRRDPVFFYMIVQGIADLACDSFQGMPTTISIKRNQSEVIMPIHQGPIMGAKYPWIKECVGFMDCARDATEQSSGKWNGGAFTAWYIYEESWDHSKWRAQETDYHKALAENLVDLLGRMAFRGVVFARPSRSYRISPQDYIDGNWCIHEDKHLETADWLVFDYLSRKKQHVFSIGFRPEVLRFAVFTPTPTARLFTD